MSDSFTDFLNELNSGKKSKELEFSAFSGVDLRLDSYIPFGFPSRIPQLDLSIGRPGYPAGRIIELFGFEASGKSSAALSAVASAQRHNGYTLYIDTERTFDPDWAALNGVDVNRIVVAHTDTIEGIFAIQDKAIEARNKMDDKDSPFLMVTDSVTAVPSLESSEKGFDDPQRLGTDARSIRSGMRILNGKIASSKATSIYVNHNISKTATTPFAKQSTSAGGHAIKFFASLRLEFINCGMLKHESGGETYRDGIRVKVKVEKNKICATGRPEVECELLNKGFDIANNLFQALVDIGEITQVNQKTYSFKVPKKEETYQITKAEWPKFVAETANSVDAVYNWFLAKAQEKGFLKPYKG